MFSVYFTAPTNVPAAMAARPVAPAATAVKRIIDAVTGERDSQHRHPAQQPQPATA